jgi:hypothetical protein
VGLVNHYPLRTADAIQLSTAMLLSQTLREAQFDNVPVSRLEARSATIHQAGVDRIIMWAIREMRGDRIAAIRCCLPERIAPQTARFLDWEQPHPSSP